MDTNTDPEETIDPVGTADPDGTATVDDPAETAVEPLLTVEHITMNFDGVRALDDVSFSVLPGGVTALIGPNGAGKTTLFNCVCGLNTPEGTITFAGKSITNLPAHERAARGIARTFQTPAIVDGMTVMDNVLLGSEVTIPSGLLQALLNRPQLHAADAAARERATSLLEMLGLTDVTDSNADALPHGVRRRIEIARALMGEPRLLLLDEPAAGLAVSESSELLARLDELAEVEHFTILLVEHSVPLVMSVARHIVVLDAGRHIGEGPPEAIRIDPHVIAAYLGTED